MNKVIKISIKNFLIAALTASLLCCCTVIMLKSDKSSSALSRQAIYNSYVDGDIPMIALTFDDGPGYNDASDKILDILEKYGVRATFFMIGKNAADNPDNIKRKLQLGCELGNHTYDHNHYGSLVTRDDIKKCSEAIKKITGEYPTAFRSTGGNTTDLILDECKAEGMALYYWSLDTEDWHLRDAGKIYDTVISNVKDGDIILMHDIYDSTANAVNLIIPKLLDEGYQFVSVSELVRYKSGKLPEAGKQYVNGIEIKNHTY